MILKNFIPAAIGTTALTLAFSAFAQTATPCTSYYTTGVAIPSGYGAADYLTGWGQMEVFANCGKATPTLVTGGNVSTDHVSKLAYIYLNDAWQPQHLISSSALQSNNWYTGSTHVALPSSAVTSTYTHAVGYVCARSDTAWQCGCADSAYTTGYWQLQAFKTSQQTTRSDTTGGTIGTSGGTTGGTSGGTTGSTTRGTCTACDVTITVHSGAVQRFDGVGANAVPIPDASGNLDWSNRNWGQIPSNVYCPRYSAMPSVQVI